MSACLAEAERMTIMTFSPLDRYAIWENGNLGGINV